MDLELNSSFEGHIDDSLTLFSDGPPSPEHNGCSVTVENIRLIEEEADYKSDVSSGEETDSETPVQANLAITGTRMLRSGRG